ncbi:MAG: DMT(drug/metabolite transporter) superfamily permease [Deltaproteobacteria bacterium]|jgi:drug/metabolite transporter (DMT)-like permease|nr:DMT(drug/metabolite transporter) superfamily permease [Deltaproteobacteria bacterium]
MIDPIKPKKAVTETLPKLGLVLLIFLSIFWGSSWPIMKIGLREIPVWTFRTLCLFLGGFGVLCIAKVNGLTLTVPRSELRPLILVSLLNVTGWHLCSAYGLVHMEAGRAVIIGYTMPVWASILGSFVLGERLTLPRLTGLFLGIAGLLILIGPDLKVLGSVPLGAIFMLGAAVTWAGGTVLLKYFRWTLPITVLTGWQLILGGIPVIIGAFILEPRTVLLQASWRAALATGYAILVGNIFCFWAWVKVVNLFPASVASIGTLAIPVIGVLSSAVVLGERIGFGEIAALILVVMALSIVMIRPKRF